MAANYSAINHSQQQLNSSPYGSGDPYLNQSTGYIAPMGAGKKKSNKWLKIGLPVLLVCVIVAAVVGGVVGSRKSNSSSSSSSQGSAGSPGGQAAASQAVSAKLEIGRFATATNSYYQVPVYPAMTNTAAFSSPTFAASSGKLKWPDDPFKPASPNVNTVRQDRPLLIAPAYKWAALPDLIKSEPYLKGWNDTIFGNASAYAQLQPVKYNMDGPSGILDNAREIKMRIKTYAYVQRMTGDNQWADKAYAEIQNAVSPNFGPNNDTKWNPSHFLDTAELTAAFAIAYDWLYDVWTADQKTFIRNNMIEYGLKKGVDAYTNPQASYGWWRGNKITGNWNCVCNGGLTLGSLAILNDDDTGIAKQLLGLTIPNAKEGCAQAPMTDGSWAETPNYWYFGTTGHAEMAAALISATGDHYGLLDANPNFYKTGLYHMAVYGSVSMFDYGDHGPNKFSTTANSMIFYGSQYNQPRYTLFQRDRPDAAEPWSMFWYDPSIAGAYWDNMDLDILFDGDVDKWAMMRSSWTDEDALYVAMKAGKNQGLQTHNDLDVGDFVLDALGTRWAGELGSGDYNSPEYFNSQDQNAVRWTYYRKMTEGQNTLVIKGGNQNVMADPTVKFETSGTKQGSSTVFDVPADSNAYFVADMSSAYSDATSVKRGVRVLNKRRQVLIQDEINSTGDIQWRMHTNATVAIDGATVTLQRDGKTCKLTVLNPPQGMQITQTEAKRSAGSTVAAPPVADQENPGVSVVVISIPAGQANLQVLFNPQWDGMKDGDFVTPTSVSLDNWSLTSHN